MTLLSQTGGHGDGWFPSGQTVEFWPVYPGMPDGLVDGPEAMRRKVRELVRAGADVVVVDGDPFELATLPERIAAVVQDGRLVSGHL